MEDTVVTRREPELPKSVRNLIEAHEGLNRNHHGVLDGGDKYLFVKMEHNSDVTPPSNLPYIVPDTGDEIYFLIPAETVISDRQQREASRYLAASVLEGSPLGFVPEDEIWPEDAEIVESLKAHRFEIVFANDRREKIKLLERERRPSTTPNTSLYASLARIDETTPMLIEGLMRERGVSVIFGDFDEFKTTLVLDMVTHVAMGSPWQGRAVNPRPVIYYALEGMEEIPVRLRALEASMRGKDASWGEDRAPVTVLDRISPDGRDLRAEIVRIKERWEDMFNARDRLGELPTEKVDNKKGENFECARYQRGELPPPVVVIDTLSIALSGEDEKGAKAVEFITNCLDLLKERPDMALPEYEDELKNWLKQHPNEPTTMSLPAASHVIIIHHQTKTGSDFAGHRAIGADTSGLYRVRRFGKITDAARPYAGQLTPIRVKGIPRPSPIRFDVEVVPVEGTKQTAAILKDKAKAVPKKLKPIIEALRELEDQEQISDGDINACLDEVASNRTTRNRYRKELEAAGILEPVENENGKVAFYRFHDTGAV